jgi:hypothetical protein
LSWIHGHPGDVEIFDTYLAHKQQSELPLGLVLVQLWELE